MAKANKLSVKHFNVMSALTMATGGGRLNDFMSDANDETRDAILKVAKRNLDLLIAGKPLPKKGKKVAAEKVEKVSKKVKETKTEKVGKKTKGEKAAAEAGTRGGIAMSSQKVTKLVEPINDAVLRLKDKYSDDLSALRGAVKRKVGTISGLEVSKVNRNGSAVIVYKGNKFKALFKSAGPVVKFLKTA